MKPVDPRAFPLITPARSALAGVILAGTAGGLLVIGQAFAVGHLAGALIADPGGNGWHAPAGWLAVLTVLRAVTGTLGDLSASTAAGRITTRLRARILRAALDLGGSRLSRRRSADLGVLATRGVAAVEPYVVRFLPTLVLAVVLPPATVVAIAWQDRWAALIVLLTLPLIPVFAVLIGMATQERADRQYRTLTLLAGHFLDVVRGLPTLVAFNRAGHQSGRIRSVTDRYRRATLETLKVAFVSSGALELIATISVALVAVSVGLRLAGGSMELTTALVVLLLAPEAYWPLRRVGAEFHAAAEGAAALAEVGDLLEEAAEPAGAGAWGAGPTGHDPAADPVPDRIDPVPIRIEALRVRYPGATGPALALDRAEIPATGLTAISGPSGSGKSTLLQTLLGELPAEAGAITLAGEPIVPADWRALVAQVPQTPWLTAGSIADNLRLGRPGAAEVDLWAALAAVALTETVAALPAGLETVLGEDGAGLSAGQRARLALARVVLADRPYVLLDEPTAHLDPESERIMLATLTRLAEHATVITVAHRPAVIAAAGTVLELRTPGTGPTEEAAEESPAARAAARPLPDPEDGTATATLRGRAGRRAAGIVLSALASLSGIALTATAGWLIARAAERPPVLYLMVAIVGVRTFGLARPALRYAERLVSHDVALRMLAETRARVYDVLVPLAPARLGRRRGDLLTAIVDDVDAQLDEELRVRQPRAAAALVFAVVIAFSALLIPLAALPMAVLTLGGGGLAALLARWGVARSEPELIRVRAAISEEVLSDLESARQLVLWQADEEAVARLDALGRRSARVSVRSTAALAVGRSLTVLLAGGAVLALAALAAPRLQDGSISGPMTALLLLTPLALLDVLTTLPEAGALAVRTRAARRRLEELDALSPAVAEPGDPRPIAGPAEVSLESVTVGWDREPVLEGFDGRVPAARSVGVIGASGSGKSTLAATLVRFLAPRAGRYRLAGTDTALTGSAEVRRHVGLVDDNPYLFASTVRENLRLAAPGCGDEEILAALAAAGLGRWAEQLPHGLDTLLGDGAAAVSGGERSRIGIARALLADPEVLVLDEPTAHLDGATARAVADTLLAARRGRSVVWVTHDRVGLAAMDEVWDLTSPGTSLRSPGSPSPAPR